MVVFPWLHSGKYQKNRYGLDPITDHCELEGKCVSTESVFTSVK